jgi:photosystem II stability/assembly factor-like uncharacterized protein
VAAVGHPYGPNQERGVFRTKDGGTTWQKVLYIDDETGAVDLSMDPANPRVIYAAMWQELRTPWGIEDSGPGSGLYKTIDGGDTWTQLTNGLPSGDKGKIGVAVSPARPDRVYATVAADGGGVFKSDDAGKSWQLINDNFEVRRRPYYYAHIYADPQDVDTFYTFGKAFVKSTDAGKTLQTLRLPHGDFHDLWIDPKNNQRMINGNDGGATVTFNGGRSWSTIDNQPTGQFYTAITDTRFPYRVYGSQQDNTTVSIASRTDGAGIDMTDWHTVGGGESGWIAPNPKDPDIVYGGSYFGLMTRYDRRTGEVRNITPWPDYPGGRTAAQMKYRFQWTYPIIISPHDANTIYAGANVLFRSTNEGRSWDIISPDLTRDDKSKQNGGRLEEYYCVIFALAESSKEKGAIWAGSDDGLVHLTRDGGKTWQKVTPAEMPPWSRVNIIEASPHDPATAYLAVNRYQLDDFRPYIYKTHDYGKTWKLATAGIPADVFVRTVREDPKRKGLLYAGTESGVYVSFDDGESWQSLQLNLPIVPITDLTIHDDDLIAATQGRAFWILDDLTPLHQMSDASAAAATYLFKPRVTYRSRRAGFSTRPTEGVGQNPSGGVVVYYSLKEVPAQPIKIEFLDSAGKTIQSFTNGGPVAGEQVVRERGGTRGGGMRPTVQAAAGMNRFEWDMRYPDARGIEGGTFLAGGSLRGPQAIPGGYQVRLTVGGESLTQPFEIKKDPRLAATDQDYQKQFDLLIAIRDRVSAAHDAVNEIRQLQKEIATAKGGDGVAKAGAALNAKLDGILHALWEPRYTGFDDQMLLFDLKLNNRIVALQGYVSGAEDAPTDQAQKVFAELSTELDRLLSRLKQVKDTDLVAFRKLTGSR